MRWGRKGRREFADFLEAKRHCDSMRALGVAAYVVDANGVELTVRGRPWSEPKGYYAIARAAKLRGMA